MMPMSCGVSPWAIWEVFASIKCACPPNCVMPASNAFRVRVLRSRKIMNRVRSGSSLWGRSFLNASLSSAATSRATPISSSDQSAVEMKSLPASAARAARVPPARSPISLPPSQSDSRSKCIDPLPELRRRLAAPRRQIGFVDQLVTPVPHDPAAGNHDVAHVGGLHPEDEVPGEIRGIERRWRMVLEDDQIRGGTTGEAPQPGLAEESTGKPCAGGDARQSKCGPDLRRCFTRL